MSEQTNGEADYSIDRRTALKAAGVAGVGLTGFSGQVSANGGPPSGKGACHGDFDCENEEYYVKIEFVEYYDEEEEEYICYFEEETETGLVEITDWESKKDEDCEPVYVEWEAEGYIASEVMVFGGNTCDTVEEPDGSYDADPDESDGDGLLNPGGNTAAISNLQFCLAEPETCDIYGIDRKEGDQFISAITVGAGGVTAITDAAGPLPDGRSENEPNGLAWDPFEEVFYFSVNKPEPGELGTIPFGGDEDDVTLYANFDDREAGEISAAAFAYEGKYYYFLDGGDELKSAEIEDLGDSDSDVTVEDTGIKSPVGTITFFGDIALNRDENIVYCSTNSPARFFKIDLDEGEATDLTDDVDDNFVDKQIAYGVDQDGNPQLYGTAARGGEWYELYPDTGESVTILDDEELIGEENEFTDLAHCGQAFDVKNGD